MDKEAQEKIVVPRECIPKGGVLVEAYLTDRELIVIGMPEEQGTEHDCDLMGCGTFSHVIYRINRKLPKAKTES